MPPEIHIHIDTIKIDFPALDSYVAYLREQNLAQRKIDQSVAALKENTQRLQTARLRLNSAITNPQS